MNPGPARSRRWRLTRASPEAARATASWITTMEPWLSLGYERRRLGAWLARRAQGKAVQIATDGASTLGIVVFQDDVLLGCFISLLAVRPEAGGRGVGRALVEAVATRAGARRRWLYTSSDTGNVRAARFYRSLGFERVGRLPDLIRSGRTEILWRRGVERRPLNHRA